MMDTLLRSSLPALGAALLAAFLGATEPQATETPRVKALLVGVADYDHLSDDLEGPVHDVELMEHMLVERFGARREDLTRLVTLPQAEATKPTRDRILAALDAFPDKLRKGDLAVVFMAGHGVSVPDQGDDELDGLDETFLGADAAPWDSVDKYLPGAITDDEIGDRLAALVSTGATVWMIADSCYSGSIHRGTSVRMRDVSMRSLGIPRPDVASMVASRAEGASFDDPSVDAALSSGRLVIFTAAQRDQRAGERSVQDPLQDTGAERTYGDFSYQLFREIMGGGGASTFRDLIRRTRIRYDASGVHGAIPLAVGVLDQPVPFLAPRSEAPYLVWNTRDLVLSVGAIHGIEPGTVIEVKTETAGAVRLVVERVRALDSICRMHEDHAAVSLRGALGANEPRDARLITEVVDQRRVPVWVDPAVKAALLALEDPRPLEEFLWLTEVDSKESAQWTLESSGEGVLLSSTSDAERRFWTQTGLLESTFKAIYVAHNLRRLATHPWIGGVPEGLKIRLKRRVGDSEGLTELPVGAPLRPGDFLKCEIVNETDDAWAVHLFAIGPDQSVHRLGSTDEALGPGDSDFLFAKANDGIVATDESLGSNSLLVMATRSASED
ncbi:MAG: caspase family protein, partial [Planctomycetota bacterium]